MYFILLPSNQLLLRPAKCCQWQRQILRYFRSPWRCYFGSVIGLYLSAVTDKSTGFLANLAALTGGYDRASERERERERRHRRFETAELHVHNLVNSLFCKRTAIAGSAWSSEQVWLSCELQTPGLPSIQRTALSHHIKSQDSASSTCKPVCRCQFYGRLLSHPLSTLSEPQAHLM